MLESISQLIPPGHEKALRQAFYTAAAILFVLAACIAAVYVYFVLEIFIKPLMWALLIGSFLFPLKYSLHSVIESWMTEQEKNNRPLMVACVILPFSIFDTISERLGNFVKDRLKTFLIVVLIYIVLCILQLITTLNSVKHMYDWACYLGICAWTVMVTLIEFFSRYQIILVTIFAVYILSVIVLDPAITSRYRFVATPAWMSIAIFVISIASSWQLPLGIVVTLFIAFSSASVMKEKMIQAIKDCVSFVSLRILRNNASPGKEKDESIASETTSKDEDVPDANDVVDSPMKQSSMFFKLLFIAFCFVTAWMHIKIVIFLTFPLVYWLIKQFLSPEIVKNSIGNVSQACLGYSYNDLTKYLSENYTKRQNLLCPPTVQAVFQVVHNFDRKLRLAMLGQLPMLTSVVIILSIIVGSVTLSIFFVFRIQQETFVLVQMSADVINETVSKHPEYQTWLPDNKLMLESVDSVVDNVYLQGKDFIKNKLTDNLGGDINATLIEGQVLKLWDNAYNLWLNKSTGPKPKLGVEEEFFSPLTVLEMPDITNILRGHVSSLTSVLESVFSLLQTNLKLFLTFLNTLITAFLYSGNAVLNFFVSVVVFFTALFYLLAESHEQYMPLQVLGSAGSANSWGSTIVTAIQDAVSGVFGASLKMACFYGLYTYLNHSAMGATLIYIPSLLAAGFSVVPIFATYWSCFPAALELWVLQGSLIRGLCLIFLQFLPTMFVDVAIYREMAESGSGHPYISGLSVVGGLYYFGLEGAIIGPIVLCVLVVVVNAYFRMMSQTS